PLSFSLFPCTTLFRSWARALRERIFVDCHRLRIDAGQLVCAEFAKDRNSILGHDNSVRNGMLGWRWFYLDVASARIKPANHARLDRKSTRLNSSHQII